MRPASFSRTRAFWPAPMASVPARAADAKDLFEFRYEDFELVNYQCHPAIRAPIAV